MSKVYVISDLHLGHKNILKFSPNRDGDTVAEHDGILEAKWHSVVKPRDIVWVLGDVAFTLEGLHSMRGWPGRKKLVRGNHDRFPLKDYLAVFEDVHGLVKYKGQWLSHAPIHPAELRGCINVHGHVHNATVDDGNYRNVCVEAVDGYPVELIRTKRLHDA